ncbi:MAG: hypothetical protein ACREH8_03100 [Opitutaceae bacterium]
MDPVRWTLDPDGKTSITPALRGKRGFAGSEGVFSALRSEGV